MIQNKLITKRYKVEHKGEFYFIYSDNEAEARNIINATVGKYKNRSVRIGRRGLGAKNAKS